MRFSFLFMRARMYMARELAPSGFAVFVFVIPRNYLERPIAKEPDRVVDVACRRCTRVP